MPDSQPTSNDFLDQITAVVEENIANEQFGVSELAEAMNMSRSNLLRKVKKLTKLSVSQLIRQVRLKRGMELLRKSNHNVSEVSHQVGFSSTSYFIKCFREYYGYSPGEVGRRGAEVVVDDTITSPASKRKVGNLIVGAAVALVAILALAWWWYTPVASPKMLEKSISVLPFVNDSNDSTNVYLINGLMESTLNNLQKIEDLKVISRTSAEKYRNTTKSIPEMAKELHVNYFVEGSGQKIGDQILLNIQLIEAASDRHLWSRQYRRETKDIFAMQQEIAKDIAAEIQAIITPEEKQRIETNPTADLVAYDLFLKGSDLLTKGGTENLLEATTYFKKAIEKDREFALAYANAAFAYYYLDAYQTEPKYTAELSSNADKAVLFDPKLPESLVAKSLYYMHIKQYELSVPYLQKALEYNPNSILAINYLADFYCNYVPDPTKYLEYALKGIRLDIASYDSNTLSYNYLRMGNALMQTGFIDESLKYLDKSLAYNPENPFSAYVRAWVLFARDRDGNKTKELLLKEFNKDTTRLDILQDIGKICYLMKDYKSAYTYYNRFLQMRETLHLDIYEHESIRFAIVLDKAGEHEKAKEYFRIYKHYADNDRSIYKNISLAMYYAYFGENKKALEHLKLFAKEDNYQYWILLSKYETGIDGLKEMPGYNKVINDIETKFWNTHERMKVSLEEKGLL